MCIHYRLVLSVFCCFFFFKQKTAYEMRISDWSSDVCSSDLGITLFCESRDLQPGAAAFFVGGGMAGDSNTIRILLTLDGKQYAADLKSAEVQTKALGGAAVGVGTQLSVLRPAAIGAARGLATIAASPLTPFALQAPHPMPQPPPP